VRSPLTATGQELGSYRTGSAGSPHTAFPGPCCSAGAPGHVYAGTGSVALHAKP
jgi:hypothetical protein